MYPKGGRSRESSRRPRFRPQSIKALLHLTYPADGLSVRSRNKVLCSPVLDFLLFFMCRLSIPHKLHHSPWSGGCTVGEVLYGKGEGPLFPHLLKTLVGANILILCHRLSFVFVGYRTLSSTAQMSYDRSSYRSPQVMWITYGSCLHLKNKIYFKMLFF